VFLVTLSVKKTISASKTIIRLELAEPKPIGLANRRLPAIDCCLEAGPGDNEAVATLELVNGTLDNLVDDLPGGLALVDQSSNLAHQMGAALLKSLLINVLGEVLHVMLDWDLASGGEFPNLGLAVLFPVLDVWVALDTKRTAGEDQSADVVVKSGTLDGLLVGRRSIGLVAKNKAGSDPDTGSTQHQGSSQGVSAVHSTSSKNLDGLAGHGAASALAEVNHSRDEDGGGDVAGVATTLTALSTDDVDTEVKALSDVLGVADHVHVQDTVAVELLDNVTRWASDGGDKEASAGVDDDVDEFIELSLGVVIVGATGISTDLGQEQVNTEGGFGVVQVRLEFVDLLLEHFGGVSEASNDTEAAGVSDRSSQLGASSNVHSGQEDGVLDAEELGDGSPDALS